MSQGRIIKRSKEANVTDRANPTMSSPRSLIVYRVDANVDGTNDRISISRMRVKRKDIKNTTKFVSTFLEHHKLIDPVHENTLGIQKYNYKSDNLTSELKQCTSEHFWCMTLKEEGEQWIIESKYDYLTDITDDIERVCIVIKNPELAHFWNKHDREFMGYFHDGNLPREYLNYMLQAQKKRRTKAFSGKEKTSDLESRKFLGPPNERQKPIKTQSRAPPPGNLPTSPNKKIKVRPEQGGYSFFPGPPNEVTGFKVDCGDYDGYQEKQGTQTCGMHAINILMARLNPTNQPLYRINQYSDMDFFDHIRKVILDIQEFRHGMTYTKKQKDDLKYCRDLDYGTVNEVLNFYGFVLGTFGPRGSGRTWIEQLVEDKVHYFSRTERDADGRYEDVYDKVSFDSPYHAEFLGIIMRVGDDTTASAQKGGHYIYVCYKNGCWYNLDSTAYAITSRKSAPLSKTALIELLRECSGSDRHQPSCFVIRAPEIFGNGTELFPDFSSRIYQQKMDQIKQKPELLIPRGDFGNRIW